MTQLLSVSQHNSRCTSDVVNLFTQASFFKYSSTSFTASEQPGELGHIQTRFVSKLHYNRALSNVATLSEESSTDTKVEIVPTELILLKSAPCTFKCG